ncbi:MAG: FAD-binding oxidoreductase, partial [candidate division WOR-3 bacterium]
IPRGAASSGLGGVIPTRGGIVIDLSGLDKKIEIDKSEKKVRVSAGVVWKDLEKALNQEGLALMSYPSSSPSATIGGWLSSWGYGIGNLNFGNVHDQVAKIQVVIPNGEIKEIAGDEKKKFLGMEGTTGIIVEAELKVREMPEVRECYLLKFSNKEDFTHSLSKLIVLRPYSISYANVEFAGMMHSAENLPFKRDFTYQVLIAFEGGKQDLSDTDKKIDNVVKSARSGVKVDKEEGKEEWELRFHPMKIKRKGPTLLAGDLLLPVATLNKAIEKFENLDIKLGLEGHIVSKDKSIMLAMFLTDERKFLDFLFALTNIKRLNDIAVSVGGLPYGIGLWNSSFVNKTGSEVEIKRLKEIKSELDPQHILNPDKRLGIKMFPANVIFNPYIYSILIALAGVGKRLLNLIPTSE